MEVIEWFLFYWVYGDAAWFSESKGVEFAFDVFPGAAETLLAFWDCAVSGAELALDFFVFEGLVELGFVHGGR